MDDQPGTEQSEAWCMPGCLPVAHLLISAIQFGHSKADSLFREADLLPYDDAFKSAKKLADRAEIRLGSIVFLSNTDSPADGSADSYSFGERINTYSKAY